MTPSSHLTPICSRLIEGLRRIQATKLDIPLVPLNGNKQPLGDGWQNRPFNAAELIKAIQNGGVEVPIKGEIKKIQLQGFGILTGRPITIEGRTYYLMALDQDGASAAGKIKELCGSEPLPKTVAFSSGRTGRCQYLQAVPEQYFHLIRSKKIKTGDKGDDGKPEQLEFRWTSLQSVLPPSRHPTTGQYHWVDECAIDEVKIAIAPWWVIKQMLIDPNSKTSKILDLAHRLGIEPEMSDDGKSVHQETIKQICQKAGIVEVIQAFVALLKAGKDYVGDCPFHPDNKQSLSVSPTTNLFQCSECSVGGGAAHFLNQLGNGSFQQKVQRRNQKQSQRANYHRPRTGNGSQKQWTDIDWAISYLNALAPYRADDYDEWLQVGMALHSVDYSLLSEWESFSQQSAKYKPGECAKKWNSFSSNGMIAIGTLAHMAKEDGWQSPFPPRKEAIHSDRQNNVGSSTEKETVTGDTKNNGDTSNQDKLGISATVTTVTAILKSGFKDYIERDSLDKVQARSLMSKGAFWELVAALRCSLDEVQPEDTHRLNKLIDWHSATLDFDKVLPSMAKVLYHDAEVLNIDPICLWQYLLPAALSIPGKRIGLNVQSHIIPPIIWTCLVGESGAGKSRAEGVILAPLRDWQHKEYQRWKKALKKYKESPKNASKGNQDSGEPPVQRKWLFEVATIQAVMLRLAEQAKNGSLWARDELLGLFKSLGQFSRSGDGEGLECLLKMWDGHGSVVDRVDAEKDSYTSAVIRLCITGGLQPGMFRKLFSNPDDPQGLQARFLFGVVKAKKAKRVKGYCQLSDILPDFYKWLDNLPTGQVKLSPDADRRYTNLVEQIGNQAEKESSSAIRAWMHKLSGQLLRIALGLHLFECYYNRSKNLWELTLDTLERATETARYYRSAFQVVQENIADTDSISSILLKIWDFAITTPNGITPRDTYRVIKAIGRRAKAVGRSVAAYTVHLFTTLVEMGKGTLDKNGRTIRFKANVNPPSPPSNPEPPEPPNNPPEPPDNPPEPPDNPTQQTSVTSEQLPVTSEQFSVGSNQLAVDSNQLAVEDNQTNNPVTGNSSLVTEKVTGNSSLVTEKVTVVTEAESKAEQAIEVSPETSVSPVTVQKPSSDSGGQENLGFVESTEKHSWNEVIEDINKHMKRLCWREADGSAYIQHKYNKNCRPKLSDSELLEFHKFLSERKRGYEVGDRVIVEHPDKKLNGRVAEVVSVHPGNFINVLFDHKPRKIHKVYAFYVTLFYGKTQ